MGAAVVGALVGGLVAPPAVGAAVVGASVGPDVGAAVEGAAVGAWTVGAAVVGACVGASVGAPVGGAADEDEGLNPTVRPTETRIAAEITTAAMTTPATTQRGRQSQQRALLV